VGAAGEGNGEQHQGKWAVNAAARGFLQGVHSFLRC
jgi:hypothetical protein